MHALGDYSYPRTHILVITVPVSTILLLLSSSSIKNRRGILLHSSLKPVVKVKCNSGMFSI
jgi:hypothetical protein